MTELLEWLRKYEQVFQSRKTGLLSKRKRVDYVIVLKELELKLSFLILIKLEEQ